MKHADYVIIRGQVFRWEEKAPFVLSGKSVEGAIEYDRTNEKIKCHECGRWFASLAGHIRIHDGVKAYKLKHGIRVTSALHAPKIRKKSHIQNMDVVRAAKKCNRKWNGQRGMNYSSGAERRNEKGHCPIQIPTAIQEKAVELGHTPSMLEFLSGFVQAAEKRFGSWRKACEFAGLVPNEIYRETFSRQLLIDKLVDFFVLNKRVPKQREFGRGGSLPSAKPYYRVFGSLANAYQAAGLLLVANEQVA